MIDVSLKILIANLSLFLFLLDDSEWKLSLEKDEISIYTRNIESSNFKEFLAEATMRGSIEEFREIIMGINNYPEWMPDCKSAEIIDHPNPNDLTYHMKLKVPFPFSNRDIVQQLVLSEHDDMLEIEIINRPLKVKETKKYVRLQRAYGKWSIKQASDENISIRFQYFADPGGDIPAWLVNSFVVKNPHITLLNMKEMMAKE